MANAKGKCESMASLATEYGTRIGAQSQVTKPGRPGGRQNATASGVRAEPNVTQLGKS